MPLEWRTVSRDDEPSLGELIARKRYSQAIDLLRRQMRGRQPTAQTRLQLADLLILAGRGTEGVPVLLSLADEFAQEGFVAKAVAILKRVEKIEPGLHVERRLAALAARRGSGATKPVARPLELGIEEVGADTLNRLRRARERFDAPAGPARPDVGDDDDGRVEDPGVALAPEDSLEALVDTIARARQERAVVQASGEAPSPPAAPTVPEPGEAPAPMVSENERREAGQGEPSPEGVQAEATSTGEPTSGEQPAMLPPAAGEPAPETAGAGPSSTAPEGRFRRALRRFLSALPALAIEPEELAQLEEEEPAAAVAQTHETDGGAQPTEPARTDAPDEDTLPALAIEPEELEEEEQAPAVSQTQVTKVGAEAEEPARTDAPDEDTLPALAIEPEESQVEEHRAEPSSSEPAALASEPESTTAEAADAQGEAEPPRAAEPAAHAAPDADLLMIEPEPPPPVVADAVASPAALELVDTPAAPAPSAGSPQAGEADAEPMSEAAFEDALLDLSLELLRASPRPQPPPSPRPAGGQRLPDYAFRLAGLPLFAELAEEELLALLRGLRLRTFEPGDVVLSEGEAGDSVGVLTTGQVKVFVSNPEGRNFEVARLRDGDLFGEMSSLSGRPRNATLVAATWCEVLELSKGDLDVIALAHPGVQQTVERVYVARASDPAAAAARSVSLGDPRQRRKGLLALAAHFGQERWEPRMRLRLAELLVQTGKHEEAISVLADLADDLARQSLPAKAVAVLKKIEALRNRHIEEFSIAPLRPDEPDTPGGDAGPAAPAQSATGETETSFQSWVQEVMRERLRAGAGAVVTALPEGLDPARAGVYAHGLHSSPLFASLSEDELLEVMRGVRLLTFRAGDVIVTEGERGEGLFILASGTVKVFGRDVLGHNVLLSHLSEGAFFGEVSTLSGRPRTATVTAAMPCEILELDRSDVDQIASRHPRVREVIEEFFIERAAASRPEGAAPQPPDPPLTPPE